jgi:transposase
VGQQGTLTRVWAKRGTRPRTPRDQRRIWAYILGAGFHIAKDLAIPRNITPMRLPAYSPELNPIENVWEYLRGNQLSNTVYETYDEIVTACCDAWNFFADDPERVATITTRSWATVNA